MTCQSDTSYLHFRGVSRKPRIAFGPTEVEKKKAIAFKECMVGFAIRVDKGNNAKQALDKKLMEGLQSIQYYIDI